MNELTWIHRDLRLAARPLMLREIRRRMLYRSQITSNREEYDITLTRSEDITQIHMYIWEGLSLRFVNGDGPRHHKRYLKN
jgi:hypothetical protein